MKQATSFFVVFGDKPNEDFSNVRVINSLIIPQIGNTIRCFDKVLRVVGVLIDYKNVDKYEGDDPKRGGEYVYILTEYL